MPEQKFVYRLVVDHWPTPDGEPFVDQPLEWWQAIVDYFYNPVGDDPTPEWLPDISPYLEDPGDSWTPPSWAMKPPFTRLLSPCGTSAAYKRHLREGQRPCEPCLRASRRDYHEKAARR